MDRRPISVPAVAAAGLDDCWNRIGVRGDGSCPALDQYAHCRNCPVYFAAAAAVLDSQAPAGYVADRTTHFAQPLRAEDSETRSVVIFRVASEWLALPASIVIEVANLLPIHSLPHRSHGAVLGLASIRGELLVCVSLHQVVGAGATPKTTHQRGNPAYQRLLVLRRETVRVVCPVDEVYGVHRFHPRQLQKVPSTIARATVTYSTALLPWRGFLVGTLDDQLLFYSLKRSLQ